MSSVDTLIRRAKNGDRPAIDSLMDRYRNYLRLLVTTSGQDYQQLNRRFDSSDVVQNTLVDAFHDLPRFNGKTEPELLAWLRQLVVRNLFDLIRVHRADKRDVKRLQQLGMSVSQSSQQMEQLASGTELQLHGARSKHEATIMLADALSLLPNDYRQVLVMRYFQQATFDDIALKMNRTPGAVRMLWTRAILGLKSINSDESQL